MSGPRARRTGLRTTTAWALLCACLAAGAPASAQTGRVLDAETGAPLSGAQLLWLQGSQPVDTLGSVFAGRDGRFDLPEGWGPRGRLLVSAFGWSATEMAWERMAATGWVVRLGRDALTLDELVVTASGRARLRSQIAVPIRRIDERELQASGAPSLDRALAGLPALQVTGQAPTGSNLMIRGIGDGRVLLLVDGQPAAGALLENRDLSRMSLAGVERVEVVKGPLSSLYGSDALGGVINVLTRPPRSGFQLGVQAMSGGFGRREASATASGGERLRYRVTGSWRQEDQVPGVLDGEEVFARVWDLRSTLRLAASETWNLRTDFSLLRERQRWPLGGGFSGFNDNRGLTSWVEARREDVRGEWVTRLSVQDYEHLFRSARGEVPIAGADDEAQQERALEAVTRYSAVMGAHSVDVGVEAARRTISSPDKLVEDRAADAQVELFVQDAWDLGATVLSAGARGTWNDRWGSTVSPTLGVVRSLSDRVRARTSVARGFRAPSFKELAWSYANLGAGYSIHGSPDLVPESSWNVSGALEWTPTVRVRMELEGYANRIDDLIDLRAVGNSQQGLLIYAPRNVDRAVTRGLEASARIAASGWTWTAGYALLDAYETESRLPLDRRARHSGRLQGAWSSEGLLGASALRLDVTAQFTGAAPIIGTDADGASARIGTQERFTALDVQATAEVRTGIELILGLDNVFDARPDGWRGTTQRRVRLGVRANDLFQRTR